MKYNGLPNCNAGDDYDDGDNNNNNNNENDADNEINNNIVDNKYFS